MIADMEGPVEFEVSIGKLNQVNIDGFPTTLVSSPTPPPTIIPTPTPTPFK